MADLSDNSKIEDEFEQNKLTEVCIIEFIVRIHPLSWSSQSNLRLRSAMKLKSTNAPLESPYLADFGIDVN